MNKQSIVDRLVEDQDFYVTVQKTKLVVMFVLGLLAWAAHGFPGF